ncbi:hypothetical protein ABH924_004744 [Arthrobacter sp. GAS37]
MPEIMKREPAYAGSLTGLLPAIRRRIAIEVGSAVTKQPFLIAEPLTPLR